MKCYPLLFFFLNNFLGYGKSHTCKITIEYDGKFKYSREHKNNIVINDIRDFLSIDRVMYGYPFKLQFLVFKPKFTFYHLNILKNYNCYK